jgi:DNA repair ATPase RecN
VQLNTRQDALQAQEAKTKELTEVKEAFDGLSLELESSGKRIKELEDELQCSAGELEKLYSRLQTQKQMRQNHN